VVFGAVSGNVGTSCSGPAGDCGTQTRQKKVPHILKIESWPVERLIPYERNARKIPAAAVEKVAASITEFGWRQPIVVDEADVVIAGHTRLLAAKKLGLSSVPVHVALGLSQAQIKAYRLMDNRSADEAQWDKGLLGPEFADLKGLDFDLALTGFDGSEIAGFLALADSATEGDADAVPAPPEYPVSEPGDVWVLGRHRLVCGDSTSVGRCS
jgi:ParB-like chromosome segregation protein Spo0J